MLTLSRVIPHDQLLHPNVRYRVIVQGDYIEKLCEMRMKFEGNFTCFSCLLDLRQSQIISDEESASPVTIPSQDIPRGYSFISPLDILQDCATRLRNSKIKYHNP